jgi:hypothetical protein
MNDLSLQTEPFNGGTIDGQYWQVARRNDMLAFDCLPPRIRAYMAESFSELPASDVLYDYQFTYKYDEDATLEALESDNKTIRRAVEESTNLLDHISHSVIMVA